MYYCGYVCYCEVSRLFFVLTVYIIHCGNVSARCMHQLSCHVAEKMNRGQGDVERPSVDAPTSAE